MTKQLSLRETIEALWTNGYICVDQKLPRRNISTAVSRTVGRMNYGDTREIALRSPYGDTRTLTLAMGQDGQITYHLSEI